MIVFDVEIKNAIPPRNAAERVEGITYCEGWRDFKGMGIACCCTFDTVTRLPRVFFEEDMPALAAYMAGQETGGFNTARFDMPLLYEHGVATIGIGRHFDALREIWKALGLDPDNFNPRTHGGWSLEKIMQATFGIGKSGHGELAPILWQQGKRGQVIDYCHRDVWLEMQLIERINNGLHVLNAVGGPALYLPATRIGQFVT